MNEIEIAYRNRLEKINLLGKKFGNRWTFKRGNEVYNRAEELEVLLESFKMSYGAEPNFKGLYDKLNKTGNAFLKNETRNN